jgi:TonB family protein
MLNFLSVAFLWFAPLALPLQRGSCDHAIPPEGMHYVCVPQDTCNCRLQKDQDEPDNDEAAESPARAPSVETCLTSTVKYFVAPAYPETARRSRNQGVVRARLTVNASGTAAVKIDSGDPAFAEQVVTTLKKWKFAPANPPRTLTATFTFALAGDPADSPVTTVSGSSPLNLVITAAPPLR